MKVFQKRLINLVILLIIAIISSGSSQALDAWSYAGDSLPEPLNTSWIPATLAQKSAISYNDSNIWETKLTTGHDQFDYQMYRFNVMQPINEVKNLTVKWIGYGENKTGYDTYLYIWNYGEVSWELLDIKNLGVDGTLNGSIAINVNKYIDVNGYVNLAAGAKHYDYIPQAPPWISLEGGGDEIMTCYWSSVTDPDGDSVQYFAEIIEDSIYTYSSGWINGTSFSPGYADYLDYTCRVKTRDNFTYTESSFGSTSVSFSLNTNYIELELELNPGYNVSGYITEMFSGLPIQSASVQTNYNLNTTTDSNGFYNFTLLNDTYIINASLGGYESNSRTITIDGGDLTNVNISLLYILHNLSGYVTDVSSGLPLRGVSVRTNTGLLTTTDSSGFYNFTVFNGTYIINASIVGYDSNTTTITLNGDATNVNISLIYHPYIISGYIKEKSSGLPLSGVTVKTNTGLTMTTNDDGFYEFTMIDGKHSIVASLKDYSVNSTSVNVSGANIINANILLISSQTRSRDSWDYAGYNLPLPYDVSWIPATLVEKSAISYIDSNLWETRLTTGHDQFDYQLYRFNVMQPINEVENLTVKWIGHGENKIGYDTYLYIWNNVNVSWELLDTKNLGVDGTLGGTLTLNVNNYIDVNGYVNLAAGSKHFDYVPNAPSLIYWEGAYDEIITCHWSSVTDPDGDSVQYFAETIDPYSHTSNSGWIDGTSFSPGYADYEDYTCRVKTRDNFTYTESSFGSAPGSFSLNTDYVELKVNDQIIGNNILNISSFTTLSRSLIFWNNDVFSDNRIYYGLNETDVNNLVNGSWSMWNNNTMNPGIRLSGLLPNTTYYYRPLTWYSGTVNNSVKAMALSTSKPGVWVSPAEYMVSPIGWTGSPVNFRTINISAAPRESNGRYIPDLSLKAVIYSSSGIQIGTVNLSGMGPYYGIFILPDYFSDGWGYITIANYSMTGEFNVLKWSCANCHSDVERYPTNFTSSTVHSQHVNTQHSMSCENSCHDSSYTYFPISHSAGTWMLSGYDDAAACNNNCHKQGGLTCNECHNDIQNSLDVANTSVLSPIYGKDVHLNKRNCTECHGGLTVINPSPSCTNCHPLNSSNLTTVPDSIDMKSHSGRKTVDCGLCHNRGHDIKSLTMDIEECKNCHPGVVHNNGAQCTTCHGNDPHDVSVGGCIACHSFPDTTYFVNISLFGRHANVSISDGSNNISDEDCKACHFGSANGSMNMVPGAANETNTYFCQDCHTSNGRNPSQFNNLTDANLRKMPMPPGHGNNGCPTCHIAGAEKTRPLTKELRYHSHGPKGYSDMPN